MPQNAYCQPFLESLYELGGRGRVGDVLVLVKPKLKAVFGGVDRQALNSRSDGRWRKTAQRARHDLVKQGLSRIDSQRGVWKLTDAGVRFVETKKARGLAASSFISAT